MSLLSVTIAIPTFRRPARLAELLDALPDRLREVPVSADIDVLVVDNDPDGSAQDVCATAPVPTRYVVEPKPGIAAVRNRALAESDDRDLVAFIDDDEVPRPGWLSSLLVYWMQNRPTAVMGRVISMFGEGADPWVLATGTFSRPPRPTGQDLAVAAAGNLLLHVPEVSRLGVRFDEAIGLGAGEDTLFSRELVRAGGTIHWCNESETEDYVEPARVTRRWTMWRAYSSANTAVFVSLRLAPHAAARVKVRGAALVGGTARVVVGAIRHLYGRGTSNLVHDARGLRLVYRGRGYVAAAVGKRYEAYRRD